MKKIITTKTETELNYNDLSYVTYVYKDDTCCGFDVHGLNNSYTFAKHLIVTLRGRQGICNVKPNTSTGNVLIKFNAQNTDHNEVFLILQTTVADFIKAESFAANNVFTAHSLTEANQSRYLYPAKEDALNESAQYYETYSVYQPALMPRNEIIKKTISMALKTIATILVQHFIKKYTKKSLLRLGI
ncbi:MAG: hypothetical protein ACUZ8H_12610 [Candidatus Anammoxibacter sp.]